MGNKSEGLKLLKAEILDALRISRENQEKLDALQPEKINKETSENDLILVGYFLSGWYSNFEDIFLKITKEFENKIEDASRWHSELLYRMTLEIEGIRPAVISRKSMKYLDDLLKFRHVFRYSYAFELDWQKMSITIEKWRLGQNLIYKDIENFVNYLDQVAST